LKVSSALSLNMITLVYNNITQRGCQYFFQRIPASLEYRLAISLA
jgi:hypothetical protein